MSLDTESIEALLDLKIKVMIFLRFSSSQESVDPATELEGMNCIRQTHNYIQLTSNSSTFSAFLVPAFCVYDQLNIRNQK